MRQHILAARANSLRSYAFIAGLLIMPTSGMAEVRVQVEFRNGDRLTGSFVGANREALRFRPVSTSIANSEVMVTWATDQVVSLHLSDSAGATGCVFLVAAAASQRIADLSGGELCFKTADVVQPGAGGSPLTLRITGVMAKAAGGSAAPSATDIYSMIGSISTTPAPAPPPVVEAAKQSVNMVTALSLNAPESVVQATQSSQTFGGLAVQDFYFGDDDHLSFTASGSHTHTLSLHKPGITTDLFDSAAQFSHALSEKKNHRYIAYANADWFFNTALGVAADRSAGAGVGTPSFYSPSENLSFRASADLRYFNERLYDGKTLNLIGSNVQAQVNYSPSDQSWFITAGLSWKPTFNNWSAWQGYGNVTFTVPLGSHYCLGLTPVDDTYVDNSPPGFRRSYLKSSASLQIMLGTNPDQKCL